MKKSARFQQKMRYAQADALRSGAQGLNRARGANAFMNILGGVVGGASMGMQYNQAYGTGSSPDYGPSGQSVSSSSITTTN